LLDGSADFFPIDARRVPPPRSGPDLVLLDNQGSLVVGKAYILDHPSPIIAPVLVRGTQVGELITVSREVFNAEETAFSRQQMLTSGIIGVVSLALAAVVAWVMTNVLLAPIRRLTAGVSLLSDGHYSARLNENSTDELGQLMNDLDHLAHKLEESRASRRRWIADISHELRTPLTVLTGEIELLKDGIRPFDQQQLLSLDQEIGRLRHLTDDLYQLSVSDIGGLRYSFSPVNILDSLSVSIANIKLRASERGVDLVLKGKTRHLIKADSQRLTQLLNNLIENSLAYTNAPGKIEVSVFDDEEHVYIKVEDTPPGVAEKDCEKLFEPLYREEASRNRRSAGAGLGLAICKNIVNAHQGTITASPSALGGLCITISLPILTEV
jgi:two-component system sensor histidine kinase BaeS